MTEERAPRRRRPRQSPILVPVPRALRIGIPHPGSWPLPRGSTALALLLAAAYAIASLAAIAARLDAFALRDPSLPAYSQAMWALLHGSHDATLLGHSLFSDHLPLALCALLPAFAVFHSPTFPLGAQVMGIAAGAILLFRIGEARIGGADRSRAVALPLAVVVAYLVHPAAGGGAMLRFEPAMLAIPLLFGAHLAYVHDRRRALAICLAVAALVRDDIALFAVGYGALLAARRRAARDGLLLACGGLVYLIGARALLLPLLDGPGTHTEDVIADPARVEPGVGLLHPALVPPTFIAIVEGLAWALRRAPSRAASLALSATVAAAAIAMAARTGFPGSSAADKGDGAETAAHATERGLLVLIPNATPVIASSKFLPHVALRPRVYDVEHLPVDAREPKSSSAFDARYALVDWGEVGLGGRSASVGDPRVASTLADGSWQVLYAIDNVTLLYRAAAHPSAPVSAHATPGFRGEPRLFESVPESISAALQPIALFGRDVELVEARDRPEASTSGNRIRLALSWRFRIHPVARYRARIAILGAAGDTLASLLHPLAYTILPPSRWGEGVMRESVWLSPSAPLSAGARLLIGMEVGDPPRPLPCEVLAPEVALTADGNGALIGAWAGGASYGSGDTTATEAQR